MTERDKILGRIREALRHPAHRPGVHAHGPSTELNGRDPSTRQRWLPPGGETFEEQIERFGQASVELKTDFHLFGSSTELHAALRQLRDVEGWKRIATHQGRLCTPASDALGLPTLTTDKGYDVNELEACDASITECDALVAQTGSVLVTNRSAGGRGLSILPPHHVVLAHRNQLVRDLAAALDLIKQTYGPQFPSMISFVTGPSRTGDIERILVLGAHGPRRLSVFMF